MTPRELVNHGRRGGPLLALIPMVVGAALSPMGQEHPLIGDIAGHQQRPQMVLGAKGGLVVWQHESESSKGEHVMVQALNADGVGTGIPIRMSTATDGRMERHPRGALLPDGNAVVVWEAGTRANREIYLRLLAPNFTFLTPEVRVNTRQAGNQHMPALAVLNDGTIVVLWRSDLADGSHGGVMGQLLNAQAAKLGGEFTVHQSAQSNQSQPAVAPLKNGGFVAAWISETVNGQTPEGAPNIKGNVFGRVFNAQGAPAPDEKRLNGVEGLCSAPTLAAMEEGFLLAWVQVDEKTMSNQEDIWVRRFGADGTATGDGARHNKLTVGRQSAPTLSVNGADALVAWQCEVRQTASYEVHGRLLSGGAEFRINNRVLYHQRQPTAAVDAAGNHHVAWVDSVRDRHAILSARSYSGAADKDVTALADVSYEGEGADGVMLAGQVVKQKDPGAEEISARAAVQREAAEGAADQQAAQAAAIAQAAAGRAATGILMGVAQGATGGTAEASKSPLAGAVAGQRLPGDSAAQTALASAARKGAAITGGIARLNTSRSATASSTASNLRNIVAQSRASAVALSPAVTRSGYVDPKAGSATPSRIPASTKATTSRAEPARSQARTSAPGASAAARLSTARAAAATSSGAARAVPAVQASLVGSGKNLQLQWNTVSGGKYQVQGSPDQRTWQNVGAVRTGAGAADSVPVDAAGNLRFFRVSKNN